MNSRVVSMRGSMRAEPVGRASGKVYQWNTGELDNILKENARARGDQTLQKRILAWLRDNVNRDIPQAWYRLVLGHDLHVSVYATLRARLYRAEEGVWVHPYKPGLWLPNNDYAPIISHRKVTTTFRNDIVDALDDDAGSGQLATFNDYKFHEVGTSSTAEANTDTALVATSGIARVTGTQAQPSANVYQSVATVTADASETWQEHGIFNASTSGQLMDRSVYTGIAVVSSDQVQFTYEITFNAEA